jgi:hypothetical protein
MQTHLQMIVERPPATAPAAPQHVVQVDLDDRAFLFPAGKSVSQLLFVASGDSVAVDLSFPFNQARTPPRLSALARDDARVLARSLTLAVYQARTQHAITETMHITIEVLANGYRLQFGDLHNPIELLLGASSIWRVCQGLLRAVDAISPVQSN